MLAKRAEKLDASGIRKVFDLAAKLTDPINLSIGQPHFAIPQAIQDRAVQAIQEGANRYTVTQGIAELRQAIGAKLDEEFGPAERRILITSGWTLVTRLLSLIRILWPTNPWWRSSGPIRCWWILIRVLP